LRTAAACGAEAVSLIPLNDITPGDGSARERRERAAGLAGALGELKPMLEDHGLIGLVEPLGFSTSSLRTKAAAVEAIEALGAAGRFKLIHDTFHHFLAGETALFPEHTGIVHVSGVVDPALAAADMRDGHRVLVDERDRLGNLAQLEALAGRGYAGPISFECFAREVHDLADPESALAASADLTRSRLTKEAA
jgi:2-keto-myo-inositol isomerase